MLYIVRGKNRDQNRCLRVHAQSPEEAEAIGWKRGLFVTEVELVEKGSNQMTRLEKIVEWAYEAWKAGPKSTLKAFGRPVSGGQAAALLLCGCATWVINLKTFGFVHI